MSAFPARYMTGFLLGLLVSFLAAASSADAADWFVAPSGTPTSPAPKGSEDAPFATVNAALASGKVKGGDRILLMDGTHGYLTLRYASFESPVTIQSQNEKRAHLDGILLRDIGRNITLKNLSVWPTDPSKIPAWPGDIVHATATMTDIVVEGLVVKGARDGGQFTKWNASRWLALRFGGITVNGPRARITGNRVIGIGYGITVSGNDSQVVNNLVNGFSADGLRGLGNNSVFMRNRVFNCVKVDDHHDDGFQSWAGLTGSVKGLVLDRNVFIEWVGPAGNTPSCQLQGIGLYDGFYEDMTISNNLVAVTAWHGISVYGARNVKVINNTVVHSKGMTASHPWIMISPHKNKSPSSNTVVANNIMMSILGTTGNSPTVTYRHNSVIGTPGAVFMAPLSFDFRPKASSGFINTADASLAPRRDILNQQRPSGAAPDRGSYETMEGTASGSMRTLLDVTESSDSEPAAETAPADTSTMTAKWIKIPGLN
jgi:hypothetical protein